MRIRQKVVLAFLAVGLGLVFQGCGTTRIGDLTQHAERFKDQQVTLQGKVVETLALPFVHKGVYQLEDGTGRIWVVPAGEVPERGKKLKVTGTLRSGVEIAGKRFGLILVEGEKE